LGFQQFLKKEYRLPEDTKYIAIDFQDLLTYQLQYGKNPYYQTTYNQVIQEWANNLNGFGLIYINDTLALYQKGQADKFKLLDILPSRPEIKELRETNLDDKITFIGFNHLADNSYQLFWQANTELTVNYQLKLRLEKNDKIVYQKTYPLAYNILPATLWQKDKIIQTNYWFNFFKKIPAGDYNLKMELIEIKRGGIEVDSFRSTVNAIERMEIVGQNIDLGIINL
ncbi:MAG: hypothetical protein M1338_00895, partial [Patescibacteria group bacterium]|nr:hypothetical protein [Patescibacteria group bacterium]